MWLSTTFTSRSSGSRRPVRPIPTSPPSPRARKSLFTLDPLRRRHARRRLNVPVLPPEHPAGRDLDQGALEEKRQGEALAEEEIDRGLLGGPPRAGRRPPAAG